MTHDRKTPGTYQTLTSTCISMFTKPDTPRVSLHSFSVYSNATRNKHSSSVFEHTRHTNSQRANQKKKLVQCRDKSMLHVWQHPEATSSASIHQLCVVTTRHLHSPARLISSAVCEPLVTSHTPHTQTFPLRHVASPLCNMELLENFFPQSACKQIINPQSSQSPNH